MNETTHDQYLTRRGICRHTATRLNWRFEPGKIIMPITDAGGSRDRVRLLAPKPDGLKTYWNGERGSYTPKYNPAPGIRQAIADAGGKLLIASGDFDHATFIENGFYNVVSFASETSIPADLPAVTNSWGVTHIDYYPDNDAAGLKSARKLADVLAETGIIVNVYSLAQLAAGRKGFDTNDLWQMVDFDRAAWLAALESCELATLPPSERKPKPLAPVIYDNDDFPPAFVQDIIRFLENQPKAKRRGDWLNCISPIDEDHNASFGFNIKTLAYNRFGGETGGIVDLGHKLGFHIEDYRPSTPQAPAGNMSKVSTNDVVGNYYDAADCPYWFQDGIPDTWLAAILKYLPQSVALVMLLAYRAATLPLVYRCVINPQDFTADELLEANRLLNFRIPESTVRRALTFMSSDDCLFFSKLTSISDEYMVLKNEKNTSTAGRNAIHYRFSPVKVVYAAILAYAKPRSYEQNHPVNKDNPLSDDSVLARPTVGMLIQYIAETDARQLAPTLDKIFSPLYGETETKAAKRAKRDRLYLLDSLEDYTSTPLPDWTLTRAIDLQAALVRAQFDAKGRPVSMGSIREICRIAGCSPNKVKDILVLAGIESTPRTESYELQTPDNIEGELSKMRKNVGYRGVPTTFTVLDEEGGSQRRYLIDLGKNAAAAALKAGKTVVVDFQVSNRHTVIREEAPPAPAPRQDTPAPRKQVKPTKQPTRKSPVQPMPLPGHREAWVKAQLRLGWYRLTGEIVAESLTICEIVELITDRHAAHVNPLAELARQHLGAKLSIGAITA